jgi:hypothetical protein
MVVILDIDLILLSVLFLCVFVLVAGGAVFVIRRIDSIAERWARPWREAQRKINDPDRWE